MKKIILLFAMIFLVSGCLNQASQSSVPGTVSKIVEFDVVAKQFEFEPSVIEVNQGDTVKLHITSEDVAHGFSLPKFGVNANLPPQKTVDIEFVADKKGTFPFACSVFCGSGHGDMTGELVVN